MSSADPDAAAANAQSHPPLRAFRDASLVSKPWGKFWMNPVLPGGPKADAAIAASLICGGDSSSG